jgi:16S rRNA G966 N2-methylase RsmD
VRLDWCFLDPPYAEQDSYGEALGFLSQSRLLAEDSVVVAEHDKRYELEELFGSLKRFRKLVQGDAALSFYRLG